MDTTENGSRQRLDEGKPQRITRLPDAKGRLIRPGDVVRLKDLGDDPLSGKLRRVRSLTCAVTERDQPRALWRICLLPEGRSVAAEAVLRHATEEEERRCPR